MYVGPDNVITEREDGTVMFVPMKQIQVTASNIIALDHSGRLWIRNHNDGEWVKGENPVEIYRKKKEEE